MSDDPSRTNTNEGQKLLKPSAPTAPGPSSSSAPSASTSAQQWPSSSSSAPSSSSSPAPSSSQIAAAEAASPELKVMNRFFRQLRALVAFGCYRGKSSLHLGSFVRNVPRGLASMYDLHLRDFNGCLTRPEAIDLLGLLHESMLASRENAMSFFSELTRRDDTQKLYDLLAKLNDLITSKKDGYEKKVIELMQTFKFFEMDFANDSSHELIISYVNFTKKALNKTLAAYAFCPIDKIQMHLNDFPTLEVDFNSLNMFISGQKNSLQALDISLKKPAGAESIDEAILLANAISQGLTGHVALQSLRFRSMGLIPASRLLEGLQSLPTLTRLNLSHNTIEYPYNTQTMSEKVIGSIIDAALDKDKLPALKTIDLSHCDLSQDAAKAILHHLREAEHISPLPNIILTDNPRIVSSTLSDIQSHIETRNARAPRDTFDPSSGHSR